MEQEAFDIWVKTAEGEKLELFCLNRDCSSEFRAAFTAGWNAARAEPRSDAAVQSGGREPMSEREWERLNAKD